jgi:hypothetical protein
MQLNRRTLLGVGAGSLVATLFPEVARARARSEVTPGFEETRSWEFQPRDVRLMVDAERRAHSATLTQDLRETERLRGTKRGDVLNMSIAVTSAVTVIALSTIMSDNRIYTRHIEMTPKGKTLRTATNLFDYDNATESADIVATGTDVKVAENPQVKAARASTQACPKGKHSCRTCSSYNIGQAALCCAGCAWAGSNPVAFGSCALILCSLCLGNNCTRWTYACCGV